MARNTAAVLTIVATSAAAFCCVPVTAQATAAQAVHSPSAPQGFSSLSQLGLSRRAK